MLHVEKQAYRYINIIMRLLLRSPLHRLLSSTTLVLGLAGRKSKHRYNIPISYIRTGDSLTCFTNTRWSIWWKNLYNGAPVRVRLAGQDRHGIATANGATPDVVHERLQLFLHQFPRTAHRYNVRLMADGTPNGEDIMRAVADSRTVMIDIVLVNVQGDPISSEDV